MVAKIKVGSSIARGFYYNENKVKEGVAECIHAQNFPIALERMTEVQRLGFLQKVASLNENIKANSVHISLNFAPSEQLSNEQMQQIASLYMEKIGFGNQPFLVYRHHDAGHPHLHIVTTRITMEAKAIDTHNIGIKKSEPARKELETLFGLVKAEDHQKLQYELKSAYAQRVNYGKTDSRKAIALVLNEVLKQYRYCSLPELNAVLGRYNIMADRGTEESRTYKNGGLHYKILDHDGIPVGVPIKASSFNGSPTLKYLEERFAANESLREPDKQRLKNTIDRCFMGGQINLAGLIQRLAKNNIDMVLRQSDDGRLYGITYVDHKNKCVINGSTLGKGYGAKAIQERCGMLAISSQLLTDKRAESATEKHLASGPQDHNITTHSPVSEPASPNLLEDLMRPEYSPNYVPYELSGRKKKKRKGRSL